MRKTVWYGESLHSKRFRGVGGAKTLPWNRGVLRTWNELSLQHGRPGISKYSAQYADMVLGIW